MPKSGSWKAAESRVGIWLGAKGIGKSGRLPLSGGNSGQSRSDSPHPTIFAEVKRDCSYHQAIKEFIKTKDEINKSQYSQYALLLYLKDLKDGVVMFHSSDVDKILNGYTVNKLYKKKITPKALKLYYSTEKIWKESALDKNKLCCCVALIFHFHQGIYFIMREGVIKQWWDLVLEARKERERLLKEEGK